LATLYVDGALRDGQADLIAGAGQRGGPQVNAFDGQTFQLLSSFFAWPPSFTGSVPVTSLNLDGSGE
jgi:hypothetical protein